MNKTQLTIDDIATTLNRVVEWSTKHHDILAVALVGSYARNHARKDSDIDIVILTTNPETYLDHIEWLSFFGDVISHRKENYGMVTSLHVHYANGDEIEFGITNPAWANVPTDSGTHEVVINGLIPLYDPEKLLDNLITHIAP